MAAALIEQIGIDVDALSRKIEHPKFYAKMGLRNAVFFDRETFGTDKLVVGEPTNAKSLSEYPLPEQADRAVSELLKS